MRGAIEQHQPRRALLLQIEVERARDPVGRRLALVADLRRGLRRGRQFVGRTDQGLPRFADVDLELRHARELGHGRRGRARGRIELLPLRAGEALDRGRIDSHAEIFLAPADRHRAGPQAAPMPVLVEEVQRKRRQAFFAGHEAGLVATLPARALRVLDVSEFVQRIGRAAGQRQQPPQHHADFFRAAAHQRVFGQAVDAADQAGGGQIMALMRGLIQLQRQRVGGFGRDLRLRRFRHRAAPRAAHQLRQRRAFDQIGRVDHRLAPGFAAREQAIDAGRIVGEGAEQLLHEFVAGETQDRRPRLFVLILWRRRRAVVAETRPQRLRTLPAQRMMVHRGLLPSVRRRKEEWMRVSTVFTRYSPRPACTTH